MSISYDKNVRVVFLVQEGLEKVREATEEDFLRAGYVPAGGRGNVNAPVTGEYEGTKDEDWAGTPESHKEREFLDEECEASCEDCVFLGEDHILIDLTSLPHFEGILDPFRDVMKLKDIMKTQGLDDLKGTVSGLFGPRFTETPVVKVPGSDEKPLAEGFDFNALKDFKVFNLTDLLNPESLYDPLRFTETKEKAKSAPEKKTSPVEEIAGDVFKGAFNVFNTVKDGLSGLLDPVEYPESPKPTTKESAPVTEPVKEEEVPVEEKPEFNDFEQTIIGKFEEMGLGADAKSAMRKSKEFAEFLSSSKPTPEQAKAFAEMLKNGKPPFFG